jgi:hypothetical protein
MNCLRRAANAFSFSEVFPFVSGSASPALISPSL